MTVSQAAYLMQGCGGGDPTPAVTLERLAVQQQQK